jgi:hypothetical protein
MRAIVAGKGRRLVQHLDAGKDICHRLSWRTVTPLAPARTTGFRRRSADIAERGARHHAPSYVPVRSGARTRRMLVVVRRLPSVSSAARIVRKHRPYRAGITDASADFHRLNTNCGVELCPCGWGWTRRRHHRCSRRRARSGHRCASRDRASAAATRATSAMSSTHLRQREIIAGWAHHTQKPSTRRLRKTALAADLDRDCDPTRMFVVEDGRAQ